MVEHRAGSAVVGLVAYKNNLCSGVVYDVFHLVGAACRIYSYGDCTVAVATEVGLKYFLTVRRKDSNHVALFDAEHLKGTGHLVDRFGELSPSGGLERTRVVIYRAVCHTVGAVALELMVNQGGK